MRREGSGCSRGELGDLRGLHCNLVWDLGNEIATPLRGNPKHEILNPKQYGMCKIPMTKTV
jgi:hypothetical protein